MASQSLLHKLYFAFEEVHYGIMDVLQQIGLPVYKYYVVPVEKRGIPSFLFGFLLLFLLLAGAYAYSNYGSEIDFGPLLNFTIAVPQASVSPSSSTLSFSLESEDGSVVTDVAVELYDGSRLLSRQLALAGKASFTNVPSKLLSYNVIPGSSPAGSCFVEMSGEVDSRQKSNVLVLLSKSSNCGVTPTPVITPTPTPTPTPTACPPGSPCGDPITTKSLRISLVDSRTGMSVSSPGSVVVKDAVALMELGSATVVAGSGAVSGLNVGQRVIVEGQATGYAREVSSPILLTDSVFASGYQLLLTPINTATFANSRFLVQDNNNASLSATVTVFRQGTLTPFAVLDVGANGTVEIELARNVMWFATVYSNGYADYGTPFFAAGDSIVAKLSLLINDTLRYCRVSVAAGEVGIADPVTVSVIYSNLSAPPSNVTLFCGTNAGQQVILTSCTGTSGNCTGQCVYSSTGSKAVYAQIGDFNCRSTNTVAVNVTDRGPNCQIALNPETIQPGGSTQVIVTYSNLSQVPQAGGLANALLVSCGAGGANNFATATGCSNKQGNCSTICRYYFTPSQVLDNPTRTIFVSYGGAQCVRDVRFADTSASLQASVVFRGALLPNSRVGLYKWIPNVLSYAFYASRVATAGSVLFDRLVRGDTFRVDASDGSGIMVGREVKTLDDAVNYQNVSVDLPPAFFNVTAVDAFTRQPTPDLRTANVVFSAFCRDISANGASYTQAFNLSSTCTASNASCVLSAKGFVDCFVQANSSQFVAVSPSGVFRLSANETRPIQVALQHCGQLGEACCGQSCSGAFLCSQGVCRDSVASTPVLSLSSSHGVLSSSVPTVVMVADPVFSADAVPLSFTPGIGCQGMSASIDAPAGIASCFNDVSYAGSPAPQPVLEFKSSATGCQVKPTGLSMAGATAVLVLNCDGGTQETRVGIKVLGLSNPQAGTFSPSSLTASGSAGLVYVSSQSQFERQQLDVAPGRVAASSGSDSQPPTVRLLEPLAGSSVTGPVDLSAFASDDSRVISVSFYIDGVKLATVNSTPYAAVWETANELLGVHEVKAIVLDASGNSASHAVTVTKSVDSVEALAIPGLNNLIYNNGNVYFGFERGIGLLSPSCNPYCDYATLAGSVPILPFVAFCPALPMAFLAYQNSSGASLLAKSVIAIGGSVLENVSSSLSAPLVYGGNDFAYFHRSGAVYRTDGSAVASIATLDAIPSGFSFDANAIYLSSNPSSGRLGRKDYSGSAFSTLASPSSKIVSIAVADGWVYWLEQDPGKVCKILASGLGTVSCAPFELVSPSSVAVDGAFLYLLDGATIKKLSTDWQQYSEIATGLYGARSIAVGASKVYVSIYDFASGKGMIKSVLKS